MTEEALRKKRAQLSNLYYTIRYLREDLGYGQDDDEVVALLKIGDSVFKEIKTLEAELCMDQSESENDEDSGME